MEVSHNATDLAWCAGFFDGEGNVHISHCIKKNRGYHVYKLVVSVSQIEPSPLLKLAAHLGGNVYLTNSKTMAGNGVWRWDLINLAAVDALKLMLPYLLNKRPRAEIAVASPPILMPRGGNKPRTPESIARWEFLHKSFHGN